MDKSKFEEVKRILASFRRWVLNLEEKQGSNWISTRCDIDDAATQICALFEPWLPAAEAQGEIEAMKADPEFMAGVKEGIKAFEEGRFKSWEQIKAELDIEPQPNERVYHEFPLPEEEK